MNRMSRATASLTQQGQVCLQFMNKLKQLQESRHLCDLIFELRNEKFHTHKVVVAAWSPAIYNLMAAGHSVPEIIRVQYDNTEVFGSFLAFLYSGQVDDVGEDNLIQILHLATSLQVNDLRRVCEEVLKRQVHIANIISTYHVARKFRLPNLEEYALNYMQMNLPEAVKQADFLSLSPPRFNSFLSSGWVCVMKPEVKLFLIISWLGYDVKERQQYLVLLLRYIDWSTVANDFLNEISQTENFFTTNESSLYLLLQTLFSSTIPLGPYTDSFPVLRDKYAYLLDHIVQNSYVLPLEPEEYFPVSFHVVPSLSELQDDLPAASERENPSGGGSEAAGCSVDGDNGLGASFDPSDAHDLSNDSVTAGIGLGMKKVSIVESSTVFGRKTVPSEPSESSSKTRKKQSRASASRATSRGEADALAALLEPPSSASESSAPSKGQSSTKRKSKRSARSEPVACTQGVADRSVRTAPGRKCPEEKPVQAKDSSPAKVLRPAKIPGPAKMPSTAQTPSPAKSPAAKRKRGEAGMKKSRTVKPSPVKEEPSEAASVGLNGRPKRQAAAKFSVPEKLMPRLRKTKALLKQGVAAPAAVSQKDAEKDPDDGLGEHGNAGRTSDSDDYDDKDDVDEDSATDPDYSLPKKAKCAKKISSKISSSGKFSGESPDTVAVGGTTNRFTSVKQKGHQSVLRSILTDPEPSQKPKQEPEAEQMSEDEADVDTPDAQLKKKCSECEYSAPTQRRLANHMERVHGSRATLFVCSLCQFECKWNKRFYQHMKQHFQGPPYTCDYEGCGWQAERIQVLLIHRRRHTGERPHKCPHCSARFKTRNNLIAHFKCHSEEKDHECPVCHRRFRMKNTMEQHLVTHSDLRPYLCDTCGFSTKFQSHLISHKRIHTGDVFKCGFPMCTYSSPKRSQLKAHMRSHLNIRHHVCPICQKSFVEKSHLVRHIKIHQDVRPHKCDQCEYSSSRIDKVNEHRRKYHSEEATGSKRQYKYTPRSKKGEKKKAPKGRHSAPLPSSATPAIATTGRPIRPKRTKPAHMPSSMAALVSAAERVALASPVPPETDKEVTDGRMMPAPNAAMQKGEATIFEMNGKRGRIQLDIGYGVGIPVKDESAAEVNPGGSFGRSGPSDQRRGVAADGGRLGVADQYRGVAADGGRLGVADQYRGVAADGGRLGVADQYRGVTGDPGGSAVHSDPGRAAVAEQGGRLVAVDQYSNVSPGSHPSQGAVQQQSLLHTAPHSSHTSAALLQKLAMSASCAGVGKRPAPHGAGDLNPGSMLLPQTASPDVAAASQILMSAMQQHSAAAVSAADSLAALSYGGLGPQLLPGQPDSGSQGHQQLMSNSGVPMQHGRMMTHHHDYQQQQHQQQEQEYNGLNAFMALL